MEAKSLDKIAIAEVNGLVLRRCEERKEEKVRDVNP